MTVDDELRDQVKRLTDRAEIYDCMQRYARGIDRQDRALLRSAYHDGAVDDHVGFVGVVDDSSTGHSPITARRRDTSTTCRTTPPRSTATRPTPKPITCSSGPT